METCSFSLRVGLPLYNRRLPGVSVRIFIGVMRPLWYADKADRDLEAREYTFRSFYSPNCPGGSH